MVPRSAAVLLRRLREQRGQTSAEYVGIVVVVAAIVLALASLGIGDRLAQVVRQQLVALGTDQQAGGGGGAASGGSSSSAERSPGGGGAAGTGGGGAPGDGVPRGGGANGAGGGEAPAGGGTPTTGAGSPLAQTRSEDSTPSERPPAPAEEAAEEESGGGGIGGFLSGAKDAVGGFGTGAWNGTKGVAGELWDTTKGVGRHVNVFDLEATGEQWKKTGATAKYAATHPLETTKTVVGSFVDPIKEAYAHGGVSEALGRGTVDAVGAVVGGKGLTKLGKVAKAVDEVPGGTPRPRGGADNGATGPTAGAGQPDGGLGRAAPGSEGGPGAGKAFRKSQRLDPDARCAHCGTDKDLQRDHKVPKSRGGNNSDDNMQALCGPGGNACNQKKGNKDDATAKRERQAERAPGSRPSPPRRRAPRGPRPPG